MEKQSKKITQEIADKILAGLSIQEIMAEYHLNKRQIIDVLRKATRPHSHGRGFEMTLKEANE